MNTFKTLLAFLFGGASVGQILGTFMGRSFLVWWNTPGDMKNAQCPCVQLASDTVSSLITYQLTGAVIGGILALGLGIFIVRRQPRGPKAMTPSPTSPSSPAA